MNVLVDYVGHYDLYYSMHALFEKRLGWNLYRPTDQQSWEKANVRVIENNSSLYSPSYEKDGIKIVNCKAFNYCQKLINFEQFLDMHIDFIVSTGFRNEEPLFSLQEKYKPNADFIRHIANIGEAPVVAKNVLLSTKKHLSDSINWIKFLPEHGGNFQYDPVAMKPKTIYSYFNYLLSRSSSRDLWIALKRHLKDFSFASYGKNSDSNLTVPRDQLHISMQEPMFVFHAKGMGGCGYTARQALMSGKPIIANKAFNKRYKTLGLDYLEDKINCIDLDPKVRPINKAIEIIREWSIPSVYEQKVQDVLKSVKRHMNFDQQTILIKDWLLKIKDEK